MIVILDILMELPIVVVLWVLDAWLALLAARLVLQSVRAAWAGRVRAALMTTVVADGCWLPVPWSLVVDDLVVVFHSAALLIAPVQGLSAGLWFSGAFPHERGGEIMSELPFDTDLPQDAASDINNLAKFDDKYAAAVPLANTKVPDGKYEVQIASVSLGWSRKGDQMLTYDMVVLVGPHANRHIFKNSVISDASVPVVKGDLQKLGMELDRFSDLSSRTGELVGLTLRITKLTKGEYTNVYFDKCITPF